jgi:hypothetical protein
MIEILKSNIWSQKSWQQTSLPSKSLKLQYCHIRQPLLSDSRMGGGDRIILPSELLFKVNHTTLCVGHLTYALSFYRSQNILGWSKLFVPDQKLIDILHRSQTFCARPKDDFHSVSLVFVPAQNFWERQKIQFNQKF